MRGHQRRDAGARLLAGPASPLDADQARRYRLAKPASGLPASPRGLPGATRQP